MARLSDLTGQRFGRLTVIGRGENSKSGKVRWICECDCGEQRLNCSADLTSGKVLSCGCYRIESTVRRSTTHSKSRTKLYNVWCAMRQRCSNSGGKDYGYYGGRGISVCDEWKNFLSFYEWAMANGYSDGLSIDRIDVDGNYEPSNCRWASKEAQVNNMRSNIVLEFQGESHTLAEWSKMNGISHGTLLSRFRRGWGAEKILTTPIRGVKK